MALMRWSTADKRDR